MVLLVRDGGVLPLPDEEGSAECVPVGLFVLVLLSGRHQDDRATHHPDLSLLAARKEYQPLYATRR